MITLASFSCGFAVAAEPQQNVPDSGGNTKRAGITRFSSSIGSYLVGYHRLWDPQVDDQPSQSPEIPEPVVDVPAEANLPAQQSNIPPIERYGEAPVDRTPQFLRTVTPLLGPGQWQYDYGFVYALQEFDFPILIGGNPARADLRRRTWYVPLAVRYGWNRRTQLFANMPVGWSDTELATPIDDNSRSQGGLGDISFGITRLLHENSCTGQSLVGTLRAVAPTGAARSPLLLTGTGFGNGVWQIGADLLVVQPIDPIILFYGVGYTYSFEREFEGVDVTLGQQFRYNLGLGFAASERVTLSTTFIGSYISETQLNGRSVPNTDQEPLRIRLAATIARRCRLVEPFVNIGLTRTAPAAELGIIWTR